jgi:type I restriction enzyme M protein
MTVKKKIRKAAQANKGAILGFEATLRAAANKLCGNLDPAEYKHVVLGLIFLKYISDAFEEQHAKLMVGQDQGPDPEDPDECLAEARGHEFLPSLVELSVVLTVLTNV